MLICGDRKWVDYKFIYAWVERLVENHAAVHDALKNYPRGFPPLVIIEGEADGVDTMARIAAEQLKVEVVKFPARWRKFGKKAGPIRNQQMIDEGKPDMVLAFHDDIEHSLGTMDMVTRAMRMGIYCRVITHKDGLPGPESP